MRPGLRRARDAKRSTAAESNRDDGIQSTIFLTADEGATTAQIPHPTDLATRMGVDRVVEPRGAAPQAADRLDPARPPGDAELVLEVDLLSLDATSHRQIRESCDSDPMRMAEVGTTPKS